MSLPDKPIRVLLYEDKQDYAGAFATSARKARIITEQVDNVDDLVERIVANPRKYQFIVLDARAYLHEGDKEGDEDEMNLHAVFGELKRLRYEKGIVIPYCINTGFADLKLRMGTRIDCTIFEKGNEPDLFNHIWDSYKKTDAAILRAEYPEAFDFTDEYFSEANAELFSCLLHKEHFKSNQIADRIRNLGTLRILAEHLIDIVHDKYLGGYPDVSGNMGSRLGTILQELQNRRDIPVHVFGTLTSIRKTASEFGSHTPQQAEKIADYPTNNTITGLTFCVFDAFNWAKIVLT